MTFYILGEVKHDSLEVIQSIRAYQQGVESGKVLDPDIDVVICSEGGEDTIGYAIFDTLMAYRKVGKVTTHGYGQVCSIASLIFQAGDVRLLSPNCVFMIHNGHINVEDKVDDRVLEELSNYFQATNKRYYVNIAKRCGVPIDTVKRWCDNETYFSSEEAVKAKLADKITKVL
jgi:ATP-dependent Clp protease, protease subunit